MIRCQGTVEAGTSDAGVAHNDRTFCSKWKNLE